MVSYHTSNSYHAIRPQKSTVQLLHQHLNSITGQPHYNTLKKKKKQLSSTITTLIESQVNLISSLKNKAQLLHYHLNSITGQPLNSTSLQYTISLQLHLLYIICNNKKTKTDCFAFIFVAGLIPLLEHSWPCFVKAVLPCMLCSY